MMERKDSSQQPDDDEDESRSQSQPNNTNPPSDDADEPPLTFRPAVDDREKLLAFLRGVWELYLARREEILREQGLEDPLDAPLGGETHVVTLSTDDTEPPSAVTQDTHPASTGQQLPLDSLQEGDDPASGPEDRGDLLDEIASTQKNASSTTQEPTPPSISSQNPKRTNKSFKSPRKRKGTGNASPPPRRRQKPSQNSLSLDEVRKAAIQRAKARTSINIHAPDPEQDSPPGETEDERRRRKERINGRRKRAKKIIEIEQLDYQVMDLNNRNEALKAENEGFRVRLAQAKRILEKGGTVTAEFLCLVPKEEKKDIIDEEDSKMPAKEVPSDASESKTEPPGHLPAGSNLAYLNLANQAYPSAPAPYGGYSQSPFSHAAAAPSAAQSMIESMLHSGVSQQMHGMDPQGLPLNVLLMLQQQQQRAQAMPMQMPQALAQLPPQARAQLMLELQQRQHYQDQYAAHHNSSAGLTPNTVTASLFQQLQSTQNVSHLYAGYAARQDYPRRRGTEDPPEEGKR